MKLITYLNKTSTKLLIVFLTLSFLCLTLSYSLTENNNNNKMLRSKNKEKAQKTITTAVKPKTKQFIKSEYSVKVTKDWNIDVARAYRDFAGLGYISEEEANAQLAEIKKGKDKDKAKVSSLFKNLFEKDKWEHIITKTGNATYHNHSYTIVRNLQQKKIILTFAGSKKEQLKDEYNQSNGVAYSDNLPHIKLVQYFRNLYFAEQKEIKENFAKAYNPEQIDQVIFVGHSLGGALASIAAFDFLEEKIIKGKVSSPALITYGQPRTGNYAFANEVMKRIPIVFRHVNNFDLVIGVPACESKSNKCINEFGKETLDKNFNDYKTSFEKYVTDNKLKDKSKFFPYHFAGLILNKSDDNTVLCVTKTEVAPDDECRGTPSLEYDFHVYYYGYKVSDMWKPQVFPYDTDKENVLLNDNVDESMVIKGKLVWEEYEKNLKSWSIGNLVKGFGNTALRAAGYVHGKKKF